MQVAVLTQDPTSLSVAEMKYSDGQQLKGERVCFGLQFQGCRQKTWHGDGAGN